MSKAKYATMHLKLLLLPQSEPNQLLATCITPDNIEIVFFSKGHDHNH